MYYNDAMRSVSTIFAQHATHNGIRLSFFIYHLEIYDMTKFYHLFSMNVNNNCKAQNLKKNARNGVFTLL